MCHRDYFKKGFEMISTTQETPVQIAVFQNNSFTKEEFEKMSVLVIFLDFKIFNLLLFRQRSLKSPFKRDSQLN